MKLVTKPSIYLIGRQEMVSEELNRFLTDHGVEWSTDAGSAAETLVETAGRTCYMSFAKPRPGGNKAYLEHILQVGHGSVTEHAVWNFVFTGVSRTLTHELVRHRAGTAFSQLSQRYVDESVAEYVVPPDLQQEVAAAQEFLKRFNFESAIEFSLNTTLGYVRHERNDQEEAGLRWLYSVEQAHAEYQELVAYLAGKAAAQGLEKTEARKFARQAARSVLPNATESKIVFTANARTIRHFLEQRGSKFAEPEIRILANSLLDVVQKEAPSLFGDYERVPLPDGTFEVKTNNRKV